MTPVKVITLTQPWASLIAIGAKTYETRDWQTPYRGPLLIHAAAGLGGLDGVTKKSGMTGLYELCAQTPFFEALFLGLNKFDSPKELPRGRIVAACNLVACHPTTGAAPAEARSEDEGAFGNYDPGRFAWELTDIREAPRIRYRGGQSIRDVVRSKCDERDHWAFDNLLRSLV